MTKEGVLGEISIVMMNIDSAARLIMTMVDVLRKRGVSSDTLSHMGENS